VSAEGPNFKAGASAVLVPPVMGREGREAPNRLGARAMEDASLGLAPELG
jgi:hypothetical protein